MGMSMIRDDADRPMTTKVETVRAALLPARCAHNLPLWRVDDDDWHVIAIDHGMQLLRPCEGPVLD